MRSSPALVLALILASTGCKKAGPSCTTAADQLTTLAFDKGDKGSAKGSAKGSDAEAEAKLLPQLKSTLVTRCTEDKWSDGFVACVAGAKTDKELDPCMKGADKLTQEQQDKMLGAVSAAVEQAAPGATKKYLDKSKASEAKLNLSKLGKNAKVYFITNGTFPAGDAAQLPAAPCCSQPDHRCAATPAWATDKVWSTLDFQIDEPNQFQYTYHGDAASFTATAVGDLDCDGKAVTYTLTGSAPNGNPVTQLAEPASAP